MPIGFRRIAFAFLLIAALITLSTTYIDVAQSQESTQASVAMPAYDEQGHLRLPPNHREWIFIGSSLGMSYSEGAVGHEMFHETLMEPGAYRHFVDTGEFADGSQFVLILHGTGESVLPMRQGRFAAEIHGVEMAVKDSNRSGEEWAYYGFGGMGGVRQTAEAFPNGSCHDCHVEHAALDNVFAQFYPMLTEAAGVEVALRYVGDESDVGPSEIAGPGAAMMAPVEPHPDDEAVATTGSDPTGTETAATHEESHVVAYAGLDPVMLVEGREEMGKAEIVEDYDGWRYQFASEPNRAAFASDPQRYAPQNDTCLMSPGAPIEADLFAVHEGKVYGFASVNCREEFKSDPDGALTSNTL